MSRTSQTDGAGNAVYAVDGFSPADSYKPAATTDGNGRTTQYTWDQYGNMLTQTPPSSAARTPAATTNTYSYASFALGELTQTQVGSKTPTSYAYNEPSGLVKSITKPKPGTSGTGATVAYSFQYDAYGDITQMTTPGNGAASTITTAFNYGSSPAIGQALTVTDALGHATSFTYDAQGNKTSQTDAGYVNSSGATVQNTTFYGNTSGLLGYNIANQPVMTTYPATGQTGGGGAGMTMSYLYPGGPLLAVRNYDESGTLAREVDTRYGPEGEVRGTSGSTEAVSYQYDASYRRTQLTDGGGHATRYFYNAAGQLAQVAYPGAGAPASALAAGTRDTVSLTAYDPNGNLTGLEDGDGTVTTFAHADPQSLLTDIHYAPGPGVSALADTTYAYDAYGRKSGITDATGSQTLAYDDNDSPTAVTTTYAGLPARTVAYAYNPDGSRSGMTTPAGGFAYAYDAAGRMASLTNPFGETTAWGYAANNWLTSQAMADGDTTQIGYNGRGEVMSQATGQNGGATLAQFAVANTGGYDAVGNRLSVAASVTGMTGQTSYSYDTRNELTGETSSRAGDAGGSYAYDGAENPTTFRGQSVGAATADNQLPDNTYDGNGNPAGYNGAALTFDPQGRLTSYGTVLTCGYRADGLRAWKQSSQGRTYFLYDNLGYIVCELNTSGAVVATNTFGINGLLSRRTSVSSEYYDFDLSGNVAQRLSSTGVVSSTDVDDAFGKVTSNASGGDPFTFSGQWGGYNDVETGLVSLMHRYFDSAIGKWLTRDPTSYSGGINVYAYCQNNPTNRIDFTGEDSTTHEQCVAAAIKKATQCLARLSTGAYWDIIKCTLLSVLVGTACGVLGGGLEGFGVCFVITELVCGFFTGVQYINEADKCRQQEQQDITACDNSCPDD